MAAPQAVAGSDAVPDEVLVERLRRGEREAFDTLYDRYFRRVFGFVDRRLNSRADAEETVQEVFANVFASIDRFRGEAPFAAWIFGVTRRTLAGRFKRKRHPTMPLGDDDSEFGFAETSNEPSPLERYECQERLRGIQHAIDRRLSKDQRRLVQLHHIEERPIQEIALMLDKSEDSVKSNLYRARKLLLTR